MFIFYEFRPFFVQIMRALSIEKYGTCFWVKQNSSINVVLCITIMYV